MGWRFEFEFTDKEITRDVIGATGHGRCWVEYDREQGGWFVAPVTLEIDLGDLDTFEEEVSDDIADKFTERLSNSNIWRDRMEAETQEHIFDDRAAAAEAHADWLREGV